MAERNEEMMQAKGFENVSVDELAIVKNVINRYVNFTVVFLKIVLIFISLGAALNYISLEVSRLYQSDSVLAFYFSVITVVVLSLFFGFSFLALIQ